MDTTQIHIIQDKEKEARELIAGWDEFLKKQQEESRKDSTSRSSWAAFMDGSGQKIEA